MYIWNKVHFVQKTILRYLLILTIGLSIIGCSPEERISFNEEIRPLLNEHCVGCHGGVKQSGGFGLVFRENALGLTTSGKKAIVPGKPGQSELIRRLRHADPELRMPLDGVPLSEEEITLMERWIKQGAAWETHWAYQAVAPVSVPKDKSGWSQNPIDNFILARLQKDSLAPAARAQKAVLLRRLSLDLIGLPPAPEEVKAFVNDPDPDAYTKAVDRLLNSPRFGEHWASSWLDLARYADSRGYERDASRSIWQYRDWVIRAFNEDLPFNEFTIQQIAGDQLPKRSENQLIATAFHRNTLSNDEGGTKNEEYRIATVMDRVNTSWEVWLGTTMSCVQCHSHPYDPIRHQDYYSSYAFFNQSVDHDHVSEAPYLVTYRQEEERKIQKIDSWLKEVARPQVQGKWTKMLRLREPRIRPYEFTDVEGGIFTDRADEDFMFVHDSNYFALPVQQLDEVAALHLSYRPRGKKPPRVSIHLDGPEGEKIGESELEWRPGPVSTKRIRLQPKKGAHQLYLRFYGEPESKIAGIYTVLFEPRLPGEEVKEYEAVEAYIDELLAAKDSFRTPIMLDLPKEQERVTQVFNRGNWLVPTDTVLPDVPAIFPALPEEAVAGRLAFARWIVDPENPLTARVAVNRFWAGLFGQGIVATPEDFGSQGALPSHPDLLDWLAGQFVEELDWRVKDLLRLIVHSSTYQQASETTPQLLTVDPYNVLLARGPRIRLSAEQIRDQMLQVSGLLSDKMYGPSVMPLQPDGLWDAVVYSGLRWETSEGEDRYRRALYTFLRRSVPHPSLTAFDGTNREVCLSRRIITNTPLQALMSLNDPEVLEGARHLAKTVAPPSGTAAKKIKALYEHLFYRPPLEEDMAVLQQLYAEALDHYRDDSKAGGELIEGGDPELAALTIVVNALFNLDDFLTKS